MLGRGKASLRLRVATGPPDVGLLRKRGSSLAWPLPVLAPHSRAWLLAPSECRWKLCNPATLEPRPEQAALTVCRAKSVALFCRRTWVVGQLELGLD